MLVCTLITVRTLPSTNTCTRVTIHLVIARGTIGTRATATLINI